MLETSSLWNVNLLKKTGIVLIVFVLFVGGWGVFLFFNVFAFFFLLLAINNINHYNNILPNYFIFVFVKF